jgi:hypothetical protein
MKSTKHLHFFVVLLLMTAAGINAAEAQETKKEKKAKKEAEIRSLIDSQNFVFMAQTAFPMGRRSINLTSDFDLRVTHESIVSYLPYYGRAYSSTPGGPNGLDFTSKEFEYTVTETKKHDGWDIVIKPKDTQQAREMLLTAFKNGTANLQVTSNDKQNISFSGYITAPKPRKS